MEKKLLLLYLLKHTRKRRNARMHTIAKQKQLQRKRLQQFYQQQSMEQLLVMATVMTICSLNVSAMVRTIGCKKGAVIGMYDNIVLGIITHREWIENFRMTQETFLYV